jgi:hypothetical protein
MTTPGPRAKPIPVLKVFRHLGLPHTRCCSVLRSIGASQTKQPSRSSRGGMGGAKKDRRAPRGCGSGVGGLCGAPAVVHESDLYSPKFCRGQARLPSKKPVGCGSRKHRRDDIRRRPLSNVHGGARVSPHAVIAVTPLATTPAQRFNIRAGRDFWPPLLTKKTWRGVCL